MSGWSDRVQANTVGATPVLMVTGRVVLTAVRSQNLTAADAYVQIFDAAAAADVTIGTTVAAWWELSDPNDPSQGDGLPDGGLVFKLGIVVASTTSATGSSGANQHVRLGIQAGSL